MVVKKNAIIATIRELTRFSEISIVPSLKILCFRENKESLFWNGVNWLNCKSSGVLKVLQETRKIFYTTKMTQ